MNFTYYKDDEVIIMSTRRDTLKFAMLESSQNVAVLVHDFPGQKSHGSSESRRGEISYEDDSTHEQQGKTVKQTFSITMNGKARIEVRR